MFNVKNFTDNQNIKVIDQLGALSVLEYQKDLSVSKDAAITQYYMSEMNVKRRQLMCDLSKSNVTLQAGAMQWMLGDANATTGVKGVGDFFGKAFAAKATGESAIKPEYTGSGIVVCEPTYRHLILVDLNEWGGDAVLDDGLFMACESTIKTKAVMRKNLSSAAAGGEGLFSLGLSGHGIACLESWVPKSELIEIELNNDVVKIDGNMAVMWSNSLQFTVEKSGKSVIGSAVSGEGLVNCYRGTGKVLMAPVAKG